MSRLDAVDWITFEAAFFEKIWGGRKLRNLFGLPAPEGKDVGEAWLVSDHGNHISVVDEGPLKGANLHDLLVEAPDGLLGSVAQPTVHGRFPLLLKILDAREVLSVQVHPDDDQARRLGEPDVGKTEMWHVLQADPGSELICGLKPAVSPDAFRAAIADGTVESLMVHIAAEPGLSIFVPAGTVHAIGGGVALAEIQQNSDITYRLYDYQRRDSQGQLRELHIDKGMGVSVFGKEHGGATASISIESSGARREILAACPYFAAERVHVAGDWERDTAGKSFHILLPLDDGTRLRSERGQLGLAAYRPVLIPARAGVFTLTGAGRILDYYVPDLEGDVIAPLRLAGHSQRAIEGLLGAA